MLAIWYQKISVSWVTETTDIILLGRFGLQSSITCWYRYLVVHLIYVVCIAQTIFEGSSAKTA